MIIEHRSYKFQLPNGKTLDITPTIIQKASHYFQNNDSDCEAAGLIVGYENTKTLNIVLNDISIPHEGDIRKRAFFRLKDKKHKRFLKEQRKIKNYYMGNWHTHPQCSPIPSNIDIDEWNDVIRRDKTGCEYAFFIVFGTKEFFVWCGEFATNRIFKLTEKARVNNYYI